MFSGKMGFGNHVTFGSGLPGRHAGICRLHKVTVFLPVEARSRVPASLAAYWPAETPGEHTRRAPLHKIGIAI
jgi:hypothetical protein